MTFKSVIGIVIVTIFGMPVAFSQLVQQANFDNFQSYNANDKTEYIGSPYIDEQWHKMDIMINGKIHRHRQARFNLQKRIMEIKLRSEHKYIPENYLSTFRILNASSDSVSIFSLNYNGKYSDQLPDGLLQITQMGQYSVVSSYSAILRKASTENPLLINEDNKGRIFIKKGNFILLDSQLMQVKKEKDLSKIFPDHKKQIKAYLKDNSIDLKTHEGVVAVLKNILG